MRPVRSPQPIFNSPVRVGLNHDQVSLVYHSQPMPVIFSIFRERPGSRSDFLDSSLSYLKVTRFPFGCGNQNPIMIIHYVRSEMELPIHMLEAVMPLYHSSVRYR